MVIIHFFGIAEFSNDLDHIVLSGTRPGQEIEHPMAVVILGGLISSTMLNLFVMPVLYWRFATKRES